MDMLERVIGGPKKQSDYRDFTDQLLGKGGTGGPLDNPIAKVALAGIAAMAAQRLLGGRR